MGADTKFRFDSLQAARGVAAVMVIFYHATLLLNQKFHYVCLGNWFHFGYSGVDFFFVLSGFIITYVHADDIGRGRAALRSYLVKRFVRIYPIYWAVLTPVIFVFCFFPQFGDGHERQLLVIVKSILLLPQPQYTYPVLSVAWTLSHEVFFYALFAAAIVGGRRWTKVGFFFWITLTATAWVAGLAWSRSRSSIQYPYGFLLSSYHLEFALGCLSAVSLRRGTIRFGQLLCALGVIWFLVAGSFDERLAAAWGNAHRIFSYGIPSFFIVLGITNRERYRPWCVPGLAKYVGDASYSIYLTHYLILSLLAKCAMRLQLNTRLGLFTTFNLMVVMAIVFGCACYAVVEKPLLAAGRKRLRAFELGTARQPVTATSA